MVRGYYYTCEGGRREPATCSRRRWQGPALERLVVGVVGEIATSPAVVASVMRSAAVEGQRAASDLRSLEAAVREAHKGREAAVDAELRAGAQGRDVAPYVERVVTATAKLEAAREALEAAQAGPPKARSFDSGALIELCGQIAPALADDAVPVDVRAGWVRRVVVGVVPFETGEGAADARCNPLPGALVTLVSPDGVGRMVVRATPSGDSVVMERADG
jgi:hypothetical protein